MKKLILSITSLLFLLNANALPGCTDIKANNYNPAATINDGSCTYNGANISTVTSKNLPSVLPETSGLILWNNTLWSHNDDADIKLYSLDTSSAALIQSYPLPNTINKDWEEISQDSQYVYIGDFGNNSNGNRSDLHILRIDKTSLLLNAPLIDTIHFSYSNQTNFTPSGANNTNFDCEAFLVTADSIYLFTKQWVSEKTSIYALPKIPGTHIAELRSTINIQGLATGITYIESKRLAVICGYSKTLQPFFYLLYDFNNNDFANGNKRKISVNLGFHQIEGIATSNGLKYYVSNENLSALSIPQKLHTFDLTNFLSVYVNGLTTYLSVSKNNYPLVVYPNPSDNYIQIRANTGLIGTVFSMYTILGKKILTSTLTNTETTIDISNFEKGMYFIGFEGREEKISFVKQ